MVTPTHFLLIFSKPLGILDTEGIKKIIDLYSAYYKKNIGAKV